MGTAILRSQDFLRRRFGHEALTLTLTPPPRSGVSKANSNAAPQSRRRKRSPVAVQQHHHGRDRDRDRSSSSSSSLVSKFPAKNLVMGQVKILRRGEVMNPDDDRRSRCAEAEATEEGQEATDLALGSTDRLGPDPETVQKQIKAAEFKVMDAIYAGSGAYYASPPPSSVPLPAFLAKNGDATTDLRRLLRLDLV